MPKFHKDSVFGPGRRVPLDREQRAQFKAKLALQRRPGRVTIATEKVGLALLAMLGPDGQCDPTIAHLAERCRVDVSTVRRSIDSLRAFGFLDWERRLRRDAGTGWRAAQTSNAYVLTVPASEVHFARRVSLTVKKEKGQAGEGWEAQCESAARQLAALGFPAPETWRLVGLKT